MSAQPAMSPPSSISNRPDRYTSEPEPEKPVYPSAQPHAGTSEDEKAYPGAHAPRKTVNGNGSPDSSVDEFSKMVVEEAGHDIKFRTLSWQKATLLLFGEYVCLAILALSWSWSVVGWVGGFFITFGLGLLTWYTSYTLWQFCMRHPGITDVCELASLLFPFAPKLAYEITGFMLLTNNIFIVGFHVFTGAKIFNTLSDSAICTVWFQLISALIGILVSIPRTLNHVSTMSIVSAVAMGIAILLSLIYAGIESAPLYGYGGNYPTLGPVTTSIGTPPGQGFPAIFNAVLNIAFLWFGQALYPTFISEMRRPQDFPKALAALTILQLCLFTVTAAVGYHFMGQYATAPSIGSLREPWARKSAFAFVLVPTIIIGTIYSNVAAKFAFHRILKGSRHVHSHTVIGWGTWLGIVGGIWIVGFILGNVIPSMGDFLSIIGAAFSSMFGLIFWSVAYFRLNGGRLFATPKQSALTVLNVFIFGLGLMMFGPGLWTSISAIIAAYSGTVREPFSCISNAL